MIDKEDQTRIGNILWACFFLAAIPFVVFPYMHYYGLAVQVKEARRTARRAANPGNDVQDEWYTLSVQ